jgi:hypothetical protein
LPFKCNLQRYTEGAAEGVVSELPSRPSNAGPGIMASDTGEQ